jgi:prophage regulatory protein
MPEARFSLSGGGGCSGSPISAFSTLLLQETILRLPDPQHYRCFLSRGATADQSMEVSPMPNEPDRIIRLRTVLDRTGLSRSTVYRKIAEGTFPSQVRISVHGAGWRESAINRWIADPVAYREEITGQVARTQKTGEGAR